MPAQAVAGIEIGGVGICPHCHAGPGETLYSLFVIVKNDDLDVGRKARVNGCAKCILPEPYSATCTAEPIRVSDVIDCSRSKGRSRSIGKQARKRERECAEDIGGSTTPASGARVAKGDARNSQWMVDDKVTSGKTFTLNQKLLAKAIVDAGQTGRRPVLRIGMEGTPDVAVMLWSDAAELIRD